MDDQSQREGANQSHRKEAGLPDLYAARITSNHETLARLIQEFRLDVGCRPHAELNHDGTATLLVYTTQERINELEAAGHRVERGENVSAVGRERQADVGKGDRFEGGRIAPRGLGDKPGGYRKGGTTS